jgi:hypothetical protein
MSDPTGASGSSGAPGASGQSGGTPEPGASGVTFTQEQVDAFLADERRRNQQKYGDYDQIKNRLTQLEGANQSELEKANAKAQEAAVRAQAAIDKANRLQVRTSLVAEAAKQGAVDPDLVATLLADQLSVNADGDIEGKPDRLVQKFLEDRPYLRNGVVRGTADQGRHTSGGGQKVSASEQMDELLRKNR